MSAAMLQQTPIIPLANDIARPRSPTPAHISESGTACSVLCATNMDIMESETCECDEVTLIVEKCKFVVQRLLLEEQSRYFREVLSTVKHKQPVRIVVGGLNPCTFQLILDWMQGCLMTPDSEMVPDLFLASVKLDIPGLTQDLLGCLLQSTDSRDLMELYEYALTHGPESLCEAVHLLLVASFLQIVRSGRFLMYSAEQVFSLLTDDALAIRSEWEVWEAALRWLAYDWEHRYKRVGSVMSTVRFGLIPEEHLLVAATDPRSRFATNHPETQHWLLRGFMSHAVRRLCLEAYYSNFLPPLSLIHI